MDPTPMCVTGVGGFLHYSDDTEKPKSGIKEERTATFCKCSALALELNIKKLSQQGNIKALGELFILWSGLDIG